MTGDPKTDLWNLIIVHPLMNALILLYDLLFHDFGIAIVVLTVALRLLLYPVFLAQLRAQRAQQELGPALAELKQKYKGNRQAFTDEQMKLYREKGVSPLSGCLPVVAQMPILLGLYHALLQIGCGLGPPQPPPGFSGQFCPGMTGAELVTFLYGFVPNPILGGATLPTSSILAPWIEGGLAHKDPLFILPILAGVVTLASSLMAMPPKQPKSDDPTAASMQSMAYVTPLITVVFAVQFPAGLALYWVTSTLVSAFQQWRSSGWGRLGAHLPWLIEHLPSPSAAAMKVEQQEAIREFERDMRSGENERDQRRRRRRRR